MATSIRFKLRISFALYLTCFSIWGLIFVDRSIAENPDIPPPAFDAKWDLGDLGDNVLILTFTNKSDKPLFISPDLSVSYGVSDSRVTALNGLLNSSVISATIFFKGPVRDFDPVMHVKSPPPPIEVGPGEKKKVKFSADTIGQMSDGAATGSIYLFFNKKVINTFPIALHDGKWRSEGR